VVPWLDIINQPRKFAKLSESLDLQDQNYTVFGDLSRDFQARLPLYLSDWKDGISPKTLPAVAFLYFACLAPAVAFGGIAHTLTSGNMGVVEVLMATGLGGMIYSVLSGQPMAFIGPTGLTLAFTASLYSTCELRALPFLPMFSWVGIWTSGFLLLFSATGASNLIRYCTQFTDEIFNGLLALNFVYEAMRGLIDNFRKAQTDLQKATAFFALNIALGYYSLSRTITFMRTKPYFNEKIRSFIADIGPVLCIFVMTLITSIPGLKTIPLQKLNVPQGGVQMSNGRPLLVPFMSLPMNLRLACALPAMFLTALFFLDENITTRFVNAPRHKLNKPAAYHQDLGALGIVTFVLSIFGLPWMCAATIQSLAHIRSMAEYEKNNNDVKSEELSSVVETRLTGFLVHGAVLGSVYLLDLIGLIPMPVISGIFLFLGRRVMSGNAFLRRIKDILAETKRLPNDHEIVKVGKPVALKYTLVQVLCLGTLWALKQNKATSFFFPSLIGVLIATRLLILPKLFTDIELEGLDSNVGEM